jgi:hypothetical protein
MSATTRLISGGLTILGTLLGAGLGLFGERYLRGRGNLRCSLVGSEVRWSRHGSYSKDSQLDYTFRPSC